MISKRRFIGLVILTLIISVFFNINAFSYNGWADTYLSFCIQKGIISGDENGDLMPDQFLTREQMVKMVLNTLQIKISPNGKKVYNDVKEGRWSYNYISTYHDYVINDTHNFNPTEYVTREEFLAMTVKIAGYENYTLGLNEVFQKEFTDWNDIDQIYYKYIVAGYEKKFITGSDNKINPNDKLTRAQACAMLYRVYKTKEENPVDDEYKRPEANIPSETEPVFTTSTPLTGKSEATLEQAIKWAKSRGAHERFIEIAPIYWEYEDETGIRADVLYAQAAKETGFGKYGGRVIPEQNNWAGIKKYGATGDETDDHEYFQTPQDGVRGHFNHMAAYVGVEPVGEPHGRYKSVKSLTWAGTVKLVEELGGKWCPDLTYGANIVSDYLIPMININ